MTDFARRHPRLIFLLPTFCLLLLSGFLFRDFVFGDRVLLYKDIGSDSCTDYFPWFVHFSDYIRSEGIPSWSFSVGMGQDIFYLAGYLLLEPVTWLRADLIAHALVYQHVAKVVVVGLLFCRFLQLRNLQLPALLLGSLLLSFSAYMCMGSCWFTIADEVLCFTALLCAAQEALKRHRWGFLPVTVALVGLLGPFYLYLGALLLSFYVPAQLFVRYGWQPRLILRLCVLLAGVAFLGVGLAATVTVPYIYTILNSPRGSGATSWMTKLGSFPVFGFESRLHYITAALRFLANDLLGTGSNYRGWANYLEAPMTYCGLLPLLLFPQTFIAASRRQRIIYVLFLIGLLLPTIFPWFRYLFWLFQGDYYRAHSLFSAFGIITLGVIAFSRYVEGRSLNLWLLAGMTILLLSILYLPLREWQSVISVPIKQRVTLFLLLYGALLVIGKLIGRQDIVGWIIVVLVAVELLDFDRVTVLNRDIVRKQELRARAGFDEDTVQAVRDVKTSENAFFRLTKPGASMLTGSLSLNDPMVLGYYGTSCYSSFNSVNYTAFLTAIGAVPPNAELNTRWAIGLLDSAIWSTFACEKYALVSDRDYYRGILKYQLMKRYGKDYLFRNELFLPLGLRFNRYMTTEDFRQLTIDEKPQALLRAVVLTEQDRATIGGLSPLAISELRQEMSTTSVSDVIAACRNAPFQLTSFHQSHIEGKVGGEQRSVLVFQTAFDLGWRAFQDGKPTQVLKVDVGLLGVVLDAGEHKVELRYRTPFLGYAIAVSLLSLSILVVCVWRWPRIQLPA